MSALADRLAALSPEKRRLLEARLRREGAAAPRPPAPPLPMPPVERRGGAGPHPLTFGQQRLWFIEQLNPGSAAYNIPFAGRLRGALAPALLAAALDQVARRHEVLRTRFVVAGGGPAQLVDREPALRLPLVDLAALPVARREAEAERLTLLHPQAPFDLVHGPVVRVSLVGLGGTPPEHLLLVTMPHLVTDAWSMAIFFRELPALYEALRERRPPRLPPLPIQVADYAYWQRDWLQGETLERLLAFWQQALAGAPAVLELPTDRPRPPLQGSRGERRPLAMPAPLLARLRALGQERGATLFMILLAGLGALLERWCGQDDVLIGSPVVTRTHAETYPLIGFFINTVALRVDLRGDPTFAELLARVRAMSLATFAHQDLPFDKLVDALAVPRDPARPPLVQVNFVLQNVHIPEPAFAGIQLVASGQTDTRTARFDLQLGFFEDDRGLVGGLDRATDLFDATTIDRMGRQWLAILEAGAAAPERRVAALQGLSAAERQQLQVEWNDTAAAWDAAETRTEAAVPGALVARWAVMTPQSVALAYGEGTEVEGTVTYGELAARVEALAWRLRQLGAGPERGVAVCLERSPDLVVAALATLASGGFYLPLDPGHPRERLAYQLRDAGASVVVSRRSLAGRLGLDQAAGAALLLFDEDGTPAARTTIASHLPPPPAPEQLAYVIYTSGSTGEPKGVAVPHRALANLLLAQARLLARSGPAPPRAVLQAASPAFDASLLEVLLALAAGGTLHLASRASLLPGPAFVDLLNRRGIDTAALTPSLLALLPDDAPALLPRLTTLLAGAEPLLEDLAARWSPGRRFWNAYGPTETTVVVAAEPLRPGAAARPAIGRPLANVSLHVLDSKLRPVPLGAHGELCVGGPGVARGYLGRPDLTAASFLPDPWSAVPGARLYRTGDRVRRLADGRLDFLGRLDGQVKVRGRRVELGEVEAALAACPGVAEAAAALRGGRLVAYVVPRAESLASTSAAAAGPSAAGGLVAGVRAALGERLPEFMVPAAIVPLPALPRTPVGKVDRAALPEPGSGRPAAAAALVPPRTPRERRLAAVWAEVLGVERVGVEDDFFALGGDSILGIRLVARAAQEGLHLEPRQVFEHPTLGAQAAAAADAPAIEADQGPVTGAVPLTPIQHCFFEEEAPSPAHWNMALLLAVERPPAPAALAGAVVCLLAHHDMLRARFTRTGAGWRQEIAPPGGAPPAAVIDLGGLPEAAAGAALAAAAGAAQASLDLAAGPLIRALLVLRGGGRRARLLLVAHHLIVDGLSWRLLLEDLTRAWQALARREPPALPPKTTSFRRWAERLSEYARSAELRQELALWTALAERAPAAPPGLEEPGTEAGTAEVETALTDGETADLLAALSERLRARPEEALLAAVAVAVAGETGAGAVLVEVEGHGREPLFPRVDVSRTVGWFTAPFPVLLELAGAAAPAAGDPGALAATTAITALAAAKEALLAVPHRGIGYRLLRHGGDPRAAAALGRLPRPPLSLNFLGRLDGAFAGTPFALAPEGSGPARHPAATRPNALEVTAFLLDGCLRLSWRHHRALHERARVERLAGRCLAALRALVGAAAPAPRPADFPHSGLDQAGLDRLLARVARVTPAVPATPADTGPAAGGGAR